MQQGVARTTEPAGHSDRSSPLCCSLKRRRFLLETMLRDLPEDLLRWKPAPERWSIAEVIGHLADIEVVYADRTRRIVTEDTPRLQKYDRNGHGGDWGLRARVSYRKPARFSPGRGDQPSFCLRSIPADSGEREATHSELGISRCIRCSASGRRMTWGICGRSRSFTAHVRFTPMQGRFKNILIRNREGTSRRTRD